MNPISIGSPFTGGASGGAWNIRLAADSGPGFINGHNDYVYVTPSGQESPADQMYSPYQDTPSRTMCAASAQQAADARYLPTGAPGIRSGGSRAVVPGGLRRNHQGAACVS